MIHFPLHLSLSSALNFFPFTFPNLRTTLQSPDIKPLNRIIAMWVPRLIILIWMLCFEGFSYFNGKEKIRPYFYKDHVNLRKVRLSNAKKWPKVAPKEADTLPSFLLHRRQAIELGQEKKRLTFLSNYNMHSSAAYYFHPPFPPWTSKWCKYGSFLLFFIHASTLWGGYSDIEDHWPSGIQ